MGGGEERWERGVGLKAQREVWVAMTKGLG